MRFFNNKLSNAFNVITVDVSFDSYRYDERFFGNSYLLKIFYGAKSLFYYIYRLIEREKVVKKAVLRIQVQNYICFIEA